VTTLSLELSAAQARAAALFHAIEERGIIRPGATEETINQAIFELAKSEFGVAKHWHRRVIRSGPNTRLPFRALPPDRTVEEDDIVSLDLAPVFGTLEADFGRSYVLGNDPEKHRLRGDLEWVFRTSQAEYLARPSMTGAELFARVVGLSADRGWGFGGAHAGHLIGAFPLAVAERDAARNRIRPDNEWPMNEPGEDGKPRNWILEVHLLDPTGAFGGFFEELLTPVPNG
jgi:Xaa-Pro aminopeptidase